MIQSLCITYLPRAIDIRQMDEGSPSSLGSLGGLVVDSCTGQARYALVQCAGRDTPLAEAVPDFHLVPWNALRFDTASKGYLASFSPAQLRAAPRVASPVLAKQQLSRELSRHFGLSLSGHARC